MCFILLLAANFRGNTCQRVRKVNNTVSIHTVMPPYKLPTCPSRTHTHRLAQASGQSGHQYFVREHLNKQTEGAGDRTNNLPISGWPAPHLKPQLSSDLYGELNPHSLNLTHFWHYCAKDLNSLLREPISSMAAFLSPAALASMPKELSHLALQIKSFSWRR